MYKNKRAQQQKSAIALNTTPYYIEPRILLWNIFNWKFEHDIKWVFIFSFSFIFKEKKIRRRKKRKLKLASSFHSRSIFNFFLLYDDTVWIYFNLFSVSNKHEEKKAASQKN